MLITTPYYDSDIHGLEMFCKQCKRIGYANNQSIKAMRLDWCLENGGQFHLTWDNDKVVSVSGCHPIPQVGENTYRALFRGATLPEYQNWSKNMTKTHMNSIPFFYHLPRQLYWAGNNDVVITTNWNNPDGIKSMSKSHSIFSILEKQGIVRKLIDKMDLFHTDQSVWLLNKDKYKQVRKDYEQRIRT